MRLLFSLLVNSWLLLILPFKAIRRRWAAAPGTWLTIDVDGPVAELDRKPPFWNRRGRAFALDRLRKLIEEASTDLKVAGILLVLRNFQGGSARATTLRELVLLARSRGKQVFAYLPNGGGSRVTAIASACDRVLLGPCTELAPIGFAIESAYVKDGLDTLGLELEVMARGRYKTAAENLVSRSMSEPQQEQLGALLDSAYERLLTALETGRKADRTRALSWVNDGPWAAASAVESGLADAVLYDDEVARYLNKELPEGAPLLNGFTYLQRRTWGFRPLIRPRHIAFVELQGPILGTPQKSDDSELGTSELCSRLDAVREDERVLGLVLHVNSPGGAVVESDRLRHAVARVAQAKPVVAYFGDVAASGGYMAALGAHAIVAQPSTITGSIGVVAVRVVAQQLLAKLGIVMEVVKRGARADLHSPTRTLNGDERAHWERELDAVYQDFVGAVAISRKLAPERAEELAGGRVWSGEAALANGLVDYLGGIDCAVAEVRKRIGPQGERLPTRLWSQGHRLREVPLPGRLAWLGSLLSAAPVLWGGSSGEKVILWTPIRELDGAEGS